MQIYGTSVHIEVPLLYHGLSDESATAHTLTVTLVTVVRSSCKFKLRW